MASIKIEGLDIDVVQKATAINIIDAQAIEVTDEGIKWNGDIVILNGSNPIRNFDIRTSINSNKSATFAELNAQAQTDHSKNYDQLTVAQSKVVQTKTMASKLIAALGDTAKTGVTIEDPATLIAGVVQAFATI